MQTDTERDGDLVVLRPGIRLDIGTAPAMQERVRLHFDEGAADLLIDLSDVTYVSSIGLAVCLGSAKRARAESRRIALCALAAPVREVFEISGFLALFTVFESREAAVAAHPEGWNSVP